MRDLTERLLQRAALSDLEIPASLLRHLSRYYQLLDRWNEKINLTSLVDPDEAVDRLLLEPIAAARSLAPGGRLIDLGSGGGSPAIPLAIASGASKLVMVESRERKAAFLREAVRQLDLSIASVETSRFEALSSGDRFHSAFDVVSIRAVRVDRQTLGTASAFLIGGGQVALFRGPAGKDRLEETTPELAFVSTRQLLRQSKSRLTLLRKIE